MRPRNSERWRRRVAVEAPHELRQHPDVARITGLAAFVYLRARSLELAQCHHVLAFLIFGLCCGCSTMGREDKADVIAGRLGYEGCRLSKPLTMAQVMAKDMSGGNEASRAHPDWDALIAKYASGDAIYFIDCRNVDPTRIVAGISLYALVRDSVIIARTGDTL